MVEIKLHAQSSHSMSIRPALSLHRRLNSYKQVEFLTPEQLAELMHVETRTVYSWIEKAQENGLKFYRAPSTRGVLFEINEVLEWIRNTV